MGLLGSFFGAVGEMVLDGVKEQTGLDITKGINSIRDGERWDDVLYDIKDDMEDAAYANFRKMLRNLSNEDFKRIRTDNFIDAQMRAYEDERRRRRL